MANVFSFISGKSYSDVDTVRVTVGNPEGLSGTGIANYTKLCDPFSAPSTSGEEVILTGRYIHDDANPWANPATTG